MSAIYGGRCVGGPRDGQSLANDSKTTYVVFLEANPLTDVPFVRDGKYMFDVALATWYWHGPEMKAAA